MFISLIIVFSISFFTILVFNTFWLLSLETIVGVSLKEKIKGIIENFSDKLYVDKPFTVSFVENTIMQKFFSIILMVILLITLFIFIFKLIKFRNKKFTRKNHFLSFVPIFLLSICFFVPTYFSLATFGIITLVFIYFTILEALEQKKIENKIISIFNSEMYLLCNNLLMNKIYNLNFSFIGFKRVFFDKENIKNKIKQFISQYSNIRFDLINVIIKKFNTRRLSASFVIFLRMKNITSKVIFFKNIRFFDNDRHINHLMSQNSNDYNISYSDYIVADEKQEFSNDRKNLDNLRVQDKINQQISLKVPVDKSMILENKKDLLVIDREVVNYSNEKNTNTLNKPKNNSKNNLFLKFSKFVSNIFSNKKNNNKNINQNDINELKKLSNNNVSNNEKIIINEKNTNNNESDNKIVINEPTNIVINEPQSIKVNENIVNDKKDVIEKKNIDQKDNVKSKFTTSNFVDYKGVNGINKD